MIGDLTLDTITDAANTTDYEFYAGVTPIALTNTLYPSDGHIDNGILATFDATVTANDDYSDVWLSDFEGAYNGAMIFDFNFINEVAVDDQVLFVAERDEYLNQTELVNPVILDSYSGFAVSPTVIDGSDIDQTIPANTNPAEQWEGQLVVVENVAVAAIVETDLYIGSDDSWVTSFVIGDKVDYQYASTGTALDAAVASGNPVDIIGIVDWRNDDVYYRINPRSGDDITPSGGEPGVIKAWALGVDEMDVLYDHFFSITDWANGHDIAVEHTDTGPWMAPDAWNSAKGIYCRKHHLDIHFDDTVEYATSMPDFCTFILVGNNFEQVWEQIMDL